MQTHKQFQMVTECEDDQAEEVKELLCGGVCGRATGDKRA